MSSCRERRNILRVLTYHRVADPNDAPMLDPRLVSTTPAVFDQQMRYLASLLIRLNGAEHPQERLDPETLAWLRANRCYTLWRHTMTHVSELDWGDLPRTKNGVTQ